MSARLEADGTSAYTPVAIDPSLKSGGGGSGAETCGIRRRRPPSPEEQRRREEWGKRWGRLVSDAVREVLSKGE